MGDLTRPPTTSNREIIYRSHISNRENKSEKHHLNLEGRKGNHLKRNAITKQILTSKENSMLELNFSGSENEFN